MPTPKRVFLIVVRYTTLIAALGFLIFYVWRAQGKQNALFSSSKNLRALSSTESQYFLSEPAPGVPVSSPTPPQPTSFSPAASASAPSFLDDASRESEAMVDLFRFGFFPDRSMTLGGSKSMSMPPVEVSDFFRFWAVPPKTTFHTHGLPAVQEVPGEVTFGERSISVRTDANEQEPAPAPTETEP